MIKGPQNYGRQFTNSISVGMMGITNTLLTNSINGSAVFS